MPTIVRDGQTIAYDALGEGPRTIILSHNLLCDRTVFTAHAAKLAGRGRVLNVDSRGHGESRPAVRPFSVRDVARDLAAVLDAEKVASATIVGVSLGATAAMELALERPERVEALVLMAASALAPTLRDVLENRSLAAAVRILGTRPAIMKKAVPVLFGASFRKESPGTIAEWQRKLCAMGSRECAWAIRAWTKREGLLERLAAIRVPTLVVSGEEDAPHPPPLGEMIRDAIPGAEFALVRKAGHTMTLERPLETLRLVERFLDKTESH